MKINLFFYRLCLFSYFVSFFTGCASTTQNHTNDTSEEVPINSIENTYWIIHNQPSNFFGNSTNPTCFVEYYLKLKNPIANDEIKKVYFTNESGFYYFELENNIDFEKGIVGTSRKHFSNSTKYMFGPDTFFIGPTNFFVVFNTGPWDGKTLDVPYPGSTNTKKFSFVYTEDFKFDSENLGELRHYNMVKALKRPEIIDFISSSDTITTTFIVHDDRFYSGGIVFFDKEQKTVAFTKPFFAYDTKVISNDINYGNVIHKDGVPNIVTVKLSNLDFKDSKTVDDIYGFFILITDGEQYPNFPFGYDCISYSNRKYLD